MDEDRAHIVAVDERDSRWEEHSPTFRVYVQSTSDRNSSASTSTFDVSGVDIEGAIRLARGMCGPRDHISIALVRDNADHSTEGGQVGRGLVWLLGQDRNENGR